MLSLAIGIVLLIGGGKILVDGSVLLARRLGVSTLLIGLTVVAFGTSAPELAFNVMAAINDEGELSFGNVVGSNIANVGLVIGISALVMPLAVHHRLVKREMPLMIGFTALLAILFWVLPGFDRHDIPSFGVTRVDGVILLGGFILFLLFIIQQARRDRIDPIVAAAAQEVARVRRGSLPLAIVLAVGGLAGLLAGGKLAEVGAVETARMFGISETLIGLTIVAIATSLPEIVASIMAARAGQTDLAVGNVVGSNIFNILLVFGVTAVVQPVPLPSPRGHFDLIVMIVFTIALFTMTMGGKGRQISRKEGMMLLLAYVCYLAASTLWEIGAANT